MTSKEQRKNQLLDLLKEAENTATNHALEWGQKYNSLHEAWAILKEEVEEAQEEMESVKQITDHLWPEVRNNLPTRFKAGSQDLIEYAENTIVELLQVIAVCNRINNGFVV